jgi:pimeloyl-ACP methyl ester carboxylesterase
MYDAVEIDFVIQYKHLTDAGYNVSTYDIRNHGNSSAANNGLRGIGQWEWRDCVGVKKHVDAHPRLSKMKVGLYSQCMGGNSQYHAIHRRPELFENVLCMCSPMVVSMAAIFDAFSDLQGVRQYQELIDLELLKMGAFVAAEMTPHLWAPSVKMPVYMVQVLRDSWTRNPEDAQKTFDLLGGRQGEGVVLDRGHDAALQGRLQLFRASPGKDHRVLRQAHEVNRQRGFGGVHFSVTARGGAQSRENRLPRPTRPWCGRRTRLSSSATTRPMICAARPWRARIANIGAQSRSAASTQNPTPIL